jgi:hypothetical protein
MTELLLDFNDIIIDDTETINDNKEEYIPKLFKPITVDNIYLLNECESNKVKIYNNNNLNVYIHRVLDINCHFQIEVILIYKELYQLYLSFDYNKINNKNGIKGGNLQIGFMNIFKEHNNCTQYIDSMPTMYMYGVEEILYNIFDDIYSLGVNIPYYKFISILKVLPIIEEIYQKYENIYSLLPSEIKNRDIFSIISNYI